MHLMSGLHVFLKAVFLMHQPLAEIIMIDKETINNRNTLPVLSIPKTDIIRGAHAKGGTGL